MVKEQNRRCVVLKKAVVLACLAVALIKTPAYADVSWDEVVQRVSKSIVKIEVYTGDGEPGTCSAFSINELHGYYLTAAHCYSPVLIIDGHVSYVVYLDRRLDLMILSVSGSKRPALKPAEGTAAAETPVVVIGFPYGVDDHDDHDESVKVGDGAVALSGAIQVADILRPTLVVGDITYRGQRWVYIDFPFLGGQSGGPIINPDGQVVSVVQASNSVRGLGRPLSVILAAIEYWWER